MNPYTQQLIGQAIECLQGGAAKQAEEILLGILNTQQNNLPALEILGLIKATQENHQEAARYLKKAVKLNPNNPATQYNLAKALSESKDYVGSLVHHERALQLASNNPDGWLNYGQTLAHLKRHEKALVAFNNVLSINPTHIDAWLNKGLTYSQLEKHADAIPCFKKAIELNPNNAKAWMDLSASLGALKHYEEALDSCEQALKLQPEYPEALLNKGAAHSELKQYEQALDCYDQALAIKNNYVDAWYNKGISLEKLNRQNEALDCYNKAISFDPNYAKAWLNKGCVLNYLSLYIDALEAFNRALFLQPKCPKTLANKAVSLHELLSFNEAIDCCNEAILIDPSYIDGYWNKAFSQLIQGNFKEGWDSYEYRWKRVNSDIYCHGNIAPLTSLTAAYDRDVLIWSEQGFGDTIQFCRYIPMLIELGVRPIFEVPKPLIALLKNQFECRTICQGDPVDAASFQTPLLSLPRLFNTDLSSIPSKTPYIHVAQNKIAQWSSRLKLSDSKLNIGIACSGNANLELKQGYKRPIPLHFFASLSKKYNLFLIQKEIFEADQISLKELSHIHQLGTLIENFEDSAAICQNMDLIISADTSLAHLAGALNKRVFILLPFCPEWRWLATGEESHWYPSATLFRQPNRGDWKTVINNVELLLDKES